MADGEKQEAGKKQEVIIEVARMVVCAVCGLSIMVGSVYFYKFLGGDGMISLLAAGAGLSIIGFGVRGEFSLW